MIKSIPLTNIIKQSYNEYSSIFNKQTNQGNNTQPRASHLLKKGYLPAIFYGLGALNLSLHMASNYFRHTSGVWFNLPSQYIIIVTYFIDMLVMLIGLYEKHQKASISKLINTNSENHSLLINDSNTTNTILTDLKKHLQSGTSIKKLLSFIAATSSLAAIASAILVIFLTKLKEKSFPITHNSSSLAKTNMALSLYGPLVAIPFYIASIYYCIKTIVKHICLYLKATTSNLNNLPNIKDLGNKFIKFNVRPLELLLRLSGALTNGIALVILCIWTSFENLIAGLFNQNKWIPTQAEKLYKINIPIFFVGSIICLTYGISKILLELIRSIRANHAEKQLKQALEQPQLDENNLVEKAFNFAEKKPSYASWLLINILKSNTDQEYKTQATEVLKRLHITNTIINTLQEEQDISPEKKAYISYYLLMYKAQLIDEIF